MKTLADLFFALDAQLSDESKAEIVQVRENQFWKLHLGVSGLIRGLVFFRNPCSEGREYFGQMGLQEEVSELLGVLYWRHLQSRSMGETEMAGIIHAKLYSPPRQLQVLAKELARSYLEYRRRTHVAYAGRM